MTPRDFLAVTDLGVGDLHAVLTLAGAPIAALGRPLEGLGAALIFEKPSTRTRHSTEVAVFQLGGHPVYTRGEEIGFDVREPVEDVARIMSGYHGLIAARVFAHRTVQRLADAASVPVINLLSEREHPTQALADVLTMQQLLGPLAGRTVAWVGDFNNVARSLAKASGMLGMHVRLGCPPGYQADDAELEEIAVLGAASVEQYDRPAEAVAGADAVHTDVFTSMGQEDERAVRDLAFEDFQVTEELMSMAADDAVFLHCLPAHRGEEVTAAVLDGPRSQVFQQGHNRLHAARALLAFLFGVRP